jgi:Tol biopolymer transport system component
VTGGEGASELTWSPDGSSLAFTVRSRLWRTLPSGEPALIADLPAAIGAGGGMTWTADDHIVYATGDDHLYVVPVSGGTPSILLERDTSTEIDFHEPFALPDGRGILFLVHARDGAMDTVHVLADGRRKPAYTQEGASISRPAYSPTGHLLFERSDANAGLWAVPFSLAKLESTGESFLITGEGSMASASRDGSLVYSNVASVGNHSLVFVDREGQVLERVGESVPHADNTTLSPDGRLFAVCILDARENSVWVYDLERDARNRLSSTGDCGGSRGQIGWSPDGTSVVFGDISSGQILLRPVDGSVEASRLAEGQQPTFTADGRFLIYIRTDSETYEDLWYLQLDGSSKPSALLATEARELEPHASPSGGLLAYVSDEHGRHDVYLRTFPEGSGVWQVSTDGGGFPRWSASGDRLYFLQDETVVMEVDVTTEPTVRLSDPRQVFAAAAHRLGPNHGWDIAAEGDRFLTVELGDVTASGGDITLVTGWNPGKTE